MFIIVAGELARKSLNLCTHEENSRLLQHEWKKAQTEICGTRNLLEILSNL